MGWHGSGGCRSSVVFEKWVAKNLSSRCVYGPGPSLTMMMMNTTDHGPSAPASSSALTKTVTGMHSNPRPHDWNILGST